MLARKLPDVLAEEVADRTVVRKKPIIQQSDSSDDDGDDGGGEDKDRGGYAQRQKQPKQAEVTSGLAGLDLS